MVIAVAMVVAVCAGAPVAGGTTTADARVIESTQIAMGWSVRNTLLGRTICNGTGQRGRKIENLLEVDCAVGAGQGHGNAAGQREALEGIRGGRQRGHGPATQVDRNSGGLIAPARRCLRSG
jgi:hypothetical protein